MFELLVWSPSHHCSAWLHLLPCTNTQPMPKINILTGWPLLGSWSSNLVWLSINFSCWFRSERQLSFGARHSRTNGSCWSDQHEMPWHILLTMASMSCYRHGVGTVQCARHQHMQGSELSNTKALGDCPAVQCFVWYAVGDTHGPHSTGHFRLAAAVALHLPVSSFRVRFKIAMPIMRNHMRVCTCLNLYPFCLCTQGKCCAAV